MDITKEQFKEWCLKQTSDHYTIKEDEAGNIRLDTDYAYGKAVFYDLNIVELLINSKETDEPQFYLHFQLKEENHAKELFTEMKNTLVSLKSKQTLKILLSCSSALTTSYFAQELNHASESLKLNYQFDAVSFNRLFDKGFEYDVILLAPQIHYEYQNVKRILKDQLVIKIPGAIFGSYSTGDLIKLVMEEWEGKQRETKKEPRIDMHTLEENEYRILTIGMINHKGQYRFGYRIYDHGKQTLNKEVIKDTYSRRDIVDLLDYITIRHKKVDYISIALPGVAYHGNLHNPDENIDDTENFGLSLSAKYQIPVMIINDVNAIALGYSAMEHADDMVFYFQPRGFGIAGAGVIHDGKLYTGWKHAAGEMRPLIVKYIPDADEKIIQPEGAEEIVTLGLLAYISTIAPEKIILYSELTPDMSILRKHLSQFIEEEYIPELIHVDRLKTYMLPGCMLYALDVMNRGDDWMERLDESAKGTAKEI